MGGLAARIYSSFQSVPLTLLLLLLLLEDGKKSRANVDVTIVSIFINKKKKKALVGRERDETLRRFISSGFCNNLLSYSRR